GEDPHNLIGKRCDGGFQLLYALSDSIPELLEARDYRVDFGLELGKVLPEPDEGPDDDTGPSLNGRRILDKPIREPLQMRQQVRGYCCGDVAECSSETRDIIIERLCLFTHRLCEDLTKRLCFSGELVYSLGAT